MHIHTYLRQAHTRCLHGMFFLFHESFLCYSSSPPHFLSARPSREKAKEMHAYACPPLVFSTFAYFHPPTPRHTAHSLTSPSYINEGQTWPIWGHILDQISSHVPPKIRHVTVDCTIFSFTWPGLPAPFCFLFTK